MNAVLAAVAIMLVMSLCRIHVVVALIIGAATALLSLLLLVPWLGLDAPRGLWRLFHGMGSFGLLSLCTSGAALFWLGMRNLEHPRH